MQIKNYENIKGIILSGGPSTVTGRNFQKVPRKYLIKKFQFWVYVMDYNLLRKFLEEK